jgi:hypothetical protein
MEPAQLDFLKELAPEPPTVWEKMAAGLQANELALPTTRDELKQWREIQTQGKPDMWPSLNSKTGR